MFKIKGTTIYLTRGDEATFDLSIDDYTFKQGDFVTFKVYKAEELNKAPLLNKKIIVNEETTKIEISLTSEETKIGEIENEPIDYWYEISLNDKQTIIGYDDKKDKILKLYPERADENVTANEQLREKIE